MSNETLGAGNRGAEDFQTFFQTLPGNYLVLQPNIPQYSIVAISDDLLQLISKQREDVVGKGFLDVFPKSPSPVTADSLSKLQASLQKVIENKVAEEVPVLRFDIPNAAGDLNVR